MTSEPRRDPVTDHLITPENSAFLLIDYQPTQINSINSMDRSKLISRIKTATKLLRDFKVPIVLSTVNVASGQNQDTIPGIRNLIPDVKSYDRTTINSWEDVEFKEAVKATGRKKLIIAGLWTEACLTFPALDALKEDYEVYPLVDVVGGTSVEAHESALRRVEQAGGQPLSLVQLACELQRDWARKETVPVFLEAMKESGAFLDMD
ncbi:isochorismatase family protein [Companilactobacillus sp. DQM5]|uniref:isochorismatase family protein n=1 Tax=Companilactobacillus sp. DQM5 TaxID=3463359 RepID=UPI0040585C05